jgi:hypothetical protein
MVRMFDLAAKVFERVLGFLGIPSWEAVGVTFELRVKSGEDGMPFISGLHYSVLGV